MASSAELSERGAPLASYAPGTSMNGLPDRRNQHPQQQQHHHHHQQQSPSSSQKFHVCPQCDRRFSRPSHLDRHVQTHLPLERRSSIACDRCSRTFSRDDVLFRHLRMAHGLEVKNRQSGQKSCLRCVRKKLKCDRAQPCRSCTVSDCACEYRSKEDEQAERPSIHQAPSTLSAASPQRAPAGAVPLTSGPASVGTSNTNEDTTMWTPSSGDASNGTTPPEFASVGAYPMWTTEEGLQPVAPKAGAFGGAGMTLNGYDCFSPENYIPNAALTPNTIQSEFRATGLDWLEIQVPDYAVSDAALLSDITMAQSAPLPTNTNATLPAIEPRQPQPWPFDQNHDIKPSQNRLPPLRLVLQGALESDRSNITDGLLHLLSEPRLPPQDDPDHVRLLSEINLLKNLLTTYFAKFHPIQPVTHVPTWSMMTCPTVLLAAMACIGAMLSDDPDITVLSDALSKICVPMTTWLGASDHLNYGDISYLDALRLHQICSLGSGSRDLYQNADRCRGVLIGSLRGKGILTSRLSIDPDIPEARAPLPHSTDETKAHSEWLAWADQERGRRVAWASFEYDCSLCTLTGRRGVVDLSELPQRLPCPDALWEAPSANAWLALRTRMGENALGATFSSILAAASAGNPLPSHVSSWSKRLCAQSIGRLLWDLKQIEILSMGCHFGLPSLASMQQNSKASLLFALDSLMKSVCEPVSTVDLISYNITSLLCHYSHLYTAQDIMDFMLFIVRNVISQPTANEEGVKTAERQLRSTFAQNPKLARKLVWHSAQIMSVANEYLVSAPCEILRLFMAYVYTIAFIKYFPRKLHDDQIRLNIRLDTHRSQQTRQFDEWISEGGVVGLGSVQNIWAPGASAAVTQDAAMIFRRLSCWGLAEKFVKILQNFDKHGG